MPCPRALPGLILLWLLLFLLLSSTALAHRVNIFAYVEGREIQVECGFSKTQRVKHGKIEVLDAKSGQLLLNGQTDEQGIFRFLIPPQASQAEKGLLVRIFAGEGHQNEWLISPAELKASGETSNKSTLPPQVRMEAKQPAECASASSESCTAALANLEERLNQSFEEKLSPIRHLLAQQYESGPNLRDIIGGLGWILGLLGLAAYFKSRS